MKKVIAALTFAILPAAANAAPAYLSCTFGSQTGQSARPPIKFTADEAEGKVSIFVTSTGHSQTLRGTFTPELVIFEDDLLKYRLSRVDLSIQRTIKLIKSTDQGKCKIESAPKRAF